MRALAAFAGLLVVASSVFAQELPPLVRACEDTPLGRAELSHLPDPPAGARGASPLAQLEAIANAQPDSLIPQLDLARCYATSGRNKDAQRVVTRALDLVRREHYQVPVPTTSQPSTTPPSMLLGKDVVKPVRVSSVAPIYPLDAQAGGVTGIVFVDVLIASDGTVRQTSIAGSVPLLDDAVLHAVSQWKYRPTQFNGAMVTVHTVVAVKFAKKADPEPTDGLDVARFCYDQQRHPEVEAALNWSLAMLKDPGRRQSMMMVDMIVLARS